MASSIESSIEQFYEDHNDTIQELMKRIREKALEDNSLVIMSPSDSDSDQENIEEEGKTFEHLFFDNVEIFKKFLKSLGFNYYYDEIMWSAGVINNNNIVIGEDVIEKYNLITAKDAFFLFINIDKRIEEFIEKIEKAAKHGSNGITWKENEYISDQYYDELKDILTQRLESMGYSVIHSGKKPNRLMTIRKPLQ